MTAPGEDVYPGDLTPAEVKALASAVLGTPPPHLAGESGDMYRDLGLTDLPEDQGISPAAAKAIADRVMGF